MLILAKFALRASSRIVNVLKAEYRIYLPMYFQTPDKCCEVFLAVSKITRRDEKMNGIFSPSRWEPWWLSG